MIVPFVSQSPNAGNVSMFRLFFASVADAPYHARDK
jgi:hypothetical protein